MSTKDYEVIASILNSRRSLHANASQRTVEAIARDMATVFEAGNPRFDEGRFLAAAGVTMRGR
jgi:hypothetical protein